MISPVQATTYQPISAKVVFQKPVETEFKAEYPDSFKLTRLQKVGRVAYNIFSVLFFPLGICRLLAHYLHIKIGEKIVPAQKTKYDENVIKKGREEWLIRNLEGTPASFTTPDGMRLDGMHIPGKRDGKKVAKNAPTLICFNGNGERYELKGGHIHMTVKSNEGKSDEAEISVTYPLSNVADFVALGYNVLLFNYRGVGQSQGRASRDGLILDGASALQFIKKRYGVPEEQIILFGHSLGGAIATQVASMSEKAKLCHVRSFASLDKEVRAIFGGIAPWMGSAVAKILWAFNWVLDTAAKWDQIKGRKWIIYHPEDPVIPFKASQFKDLQERKMAVDAVVMKNREAVRAYLESQVVKEKKRALTQLEEELVDDAANDLSDPHNRALLPEEMKAVAALWA